MYMHIHNYIYIYRERERDRDRYIHVYINAYSAMASIRSSVLSSSQALQRFVGSRCRQCPMKHTNMGTHQRGVQWEGGAVDGGSII